MMCILNGIEGKKCKRKVSLVQLDCVCLGVGGIVAGTGTVVPTTKIFCLPSLTNEHSSKEGQISCNSFLQDFFSQILCH